MGNNISTIDISCIINSYNRWRIFFRFATLSAHLTEEHNVDAKIKDIKFPDITSFQTWKDSEELSTSSRYVQQCAKQTWYHEYGSYNTGHSILHYMFG